MNFKHLTHTIKILLYVTAIITITVCLQTLEDIQSDGGVLVFYFEGREQSVTSMTNTCKNDL